MRSLSVVLLTAVLSLAGCVSGNDSTTTTIPTPSPSPSGALVKSMEAVVTLDGSSCVSQDSDDCWLPLYPQPASMGTPLNLRQEPGSPCTTDNSQGCHPRPNDIVSVVCKVVTEDRQVWFGVAMPADGVLSTDHAVKKTLMGETIGFALSRSFDLKDTELLETC